MSIGMKEVLKTWLREAGCDEVRFQSVTKEGTPSILFVEKAGVRSWFPWEEILDAWQNGMSVKSIAKRILLAGAGKGEVA